MKAGVKRVCDIIAAGALLLLASPILIASAILIKLDSPGPVLFRQRRLGKDGQEFEMFKFRTMTVDAPGRGPSITRKDDPRVTPIGRLLRRFEFDELPSLVNVLRGDMSVVGPRPEVPKYLPYYSTEHRRVLTVKPGLTDLGTLEFRDEAVYLSGDSAEERYIHEILPRKLDLNLEYIDHQSFMFDLAIVVRTIAKIVRQPKG